MRRHIVEIARLGTASAEVSPAARAGTGNIAARASRRPVHHRPGCSSFRREPENAGGRGTGPAGRGLTLVPIASRAYAIGIHPRMRFAFTVCKPLTGGADSKETSGLQRVCKWHSLAPQPRGPSRGLKCPSGHAKARKRAPAGTCVGCEDPDSEWSRKGARAQCTDASRIRRCRKGLEPSRRLSETTEPRCRPGHRGNKLASRVQSTGRILHTWRTGILVVPSAHRRPCTWSAPQ